MTQLPSNFMAKAALIPRDHTLAQPFLPRTAVHGDGPAEVAEVALRV